MVSGTIDIDMPAWYAGEMDNEDAGLNLAQT